MTEGKRRRRWPVAVGVGLVLALIGYLVVRYIQPPTEQCTTHGADGTTVTLDNSQAANAATIAAVAHSRGLPERAVTIALATAIQESKLRDIDYGDRDSLGLFQQRPSQGWGTPAEVLDPVHASGKFYDALVNVPDYLSLPVTAAAQKVQHSGYPQAYARHAGTAATLAAALSGREGAAITCTVTGVHAQPSAHPGDTVVTDAVQREFGPGLLPSPSPTDIAYPVTDTQTGWAVALWMVCHAATLHIASVAFGGREWSSDSSDQGWVDRASRPGGAASVVIAAAPA
ncbi:heavy metal transporter, partial [Streptomyces carpinensis]